MGGATHLHMFGVTRRAQTERMSQLFPSWTEASSDQVGSNGILEEQGVGSVPPHLSDRPGVLLKAGVHVAGSRGHDVIQRDRTEEPR